MDTTFKKDFMLISKMRVQTILAKILEENEKVICLLKDRDGEINEPIIDVTNDYKIRLRNGTYIKLHDKYLYNIVYDKNYYLKEHDEYYELIYSK